MKWMFAVMTLVSGVAQAESLMIDGTDGLVGYHAISETKQLILELPYKAVVQLTDLGKTLTSGARYYLTVSVEFDQGPREDRSRVETRFPDYKVVIAVPSRVQNISGEFGVPVKLKWVGAPVGVTIYFGRGELSAADGADLKSKLAGGFVPSLRIDALYKAPRVREIESVSLSVKQVCARVRSEGGGSPALKESIGLVLDQIKSDLGAVKSKTLRRRLLNSAFESCLDYSSAVGADSLSQLMQHPVQLKLSSVETLTLREIELVSDVVARDWPVETTVGKK